MIEGKKILVILPRFFYPANDGGKIVFCNSIKELAKNNELDLISNVNPTDKKYIPFAGKYFQRMSLVVFDASKQYFLKLIFSLLFQKSYFQTKYYRKDIVSKIDEYFSTKKYDIVWIESGYMSLYAEYIKNTYGTDTQVIIRSHNVEHNVLKNTASESKNRIERFFIQREIPFIEAFELKMLGYADMVFAISNLDREYFISARPDLASKIQTLHPSVDFEKYTKQHLSQEKNLVFIGTMKYLPNSFGIKWFIDNVFPQVQKTFPDVKLYILGTNLPKFLKNSTNTNIVIDSGKREDIYYYSIARIFICPLFSGGGLKIKVLNAFASGNPVLSTNTGVEGMSVNSGKEVLVANSVQEWIDILTQYLSDDSALQQLGDNGYQYVKDHFDSEKIYKNL